MKGQPLGKLRVSRRRQISRPHPLYLPPSKPRRRPYAGFYDACDGVLMIMAFDFDSQTYIVIVYMGTQCYGIRLFYSFART